VTTPTGPTGPTGPCLEADGLRFSHVCARTRFIDGTREQELPVGAHPLWDAIRSGRAILQIVRGPAAQRLPSNWAIPIGEDQRVLGYVRAPVSDGGEAIVAVVVRADTLPAPVLDESERVRIAAALADELEKELEP